MYIEFYTHVSMHAKFSTLSNSYLPPSYVICYSRFCVIIKSSVRLSQYYHFFTFNKLLSLTFVKKRGQCPWYVTIIRWFSEFNSKRLEVKNEHAMQGQNLCPPRKILISPLYNFRRLKRRNESMRVAKRRCTFRENTMFHIVVCNDVWVILTKLGFFTVIQMVKSRDPLEKCLFRWFEINMDHF